jgi:hypothetical protein
MLEYQAPTETHAYQYNDKIYHSNSKSLGFAVTHNHRMYVRKWNERLRTLSSQYSFVPTSDIGWYSGLLAAPSGFVGTRLETVTIKDDRSYSGDDFAALMGLICSDGYAGSSEGTWNLVSFANFRESCWEDINSLAIRCGFREQPSRRGVWVRWSAGALAEWIRANCYVGGSYHATTKKVPEILKRVSSDQIQRFLNYFDDRNHVDHGFTSLYYSTSNRLIDDLQELFLKVGKLSGIRSEAPGKSAVLRNGQVAVSRNRKYILTVCGTNNLSIERNKQIETDEYKDLVYCATVPNGILITRRNNRPLISGNCWAHSSTMSQHEQPPGHLDPALASPLPRWPDAGVPPTGSIESDTTGTVGHDAIGGHPTA